MTSVPSILQQGNAELGKLVNVRLEKLKLFQSQNVQDQLINPSVYGGKINSNFIDQPLFHPLKAKLPAPASTLFRQLLLKLTVNLFNSILNYYHLWILSSYISLTVPCKFPKDVVSDVLSLPARLILMYVFASLFDL